MARLFWTPQAIEDFRRVPARNARRIESRIELLAEFPLLGSAMEAPYRRFRQLPVGRFRVIYEVAGDDVRIAYIRHGARQLGLRVVLPDED